MKRRKFIQTAGLTTAAAIAAPYILPSGRLFAASGGGAAEHVVYILFAGGTRIQEATLQQYISNQPGEIEGGNIMYNMLNGTPPGAKIVYGTDGVASGDVPIPQLLGQTLQTQGTLFPEVNYSQGGTGHYYGRNTILTGNYGGFGQGLRARPVNPTIFEYVRRDMGVPATKVWYLGNGIGGSIPLLNYSEQENYGSNYGANFFAPGVTFAVEGETHLANAKVYHPEEEIAPMREMMKFLNNNWATIGSSVPDLLNTDAEKEDIKLFIKTMFEKKAAGTLAMPPGSGGNDLNTIGYACEVMQWFKPTLTVIDLSAVDSCHSSFTSYLGALHRADHGVGHIWNYIQTQIPSMAGKTMLITTPEHGRNLNPNPFLDENQWQAFDHDSDANSRRMFTLMAGPGVPANTVVGSESNPIGDATDPVPTIAEALGFQIPGSFLNASATSLFKRI